MPDNYDRIERIMTELNLDHDQIKCGRLRQPIYINEKERSICGICSLNDKKCKYTYPFVYDDCVEAQKFTRSRSRNLGELIQTSITERVK